VPTVSENEKPPTFAPLVAYSTGLIIGRFLVDIVADLIAVHLPQRNKMSTVEMDVPPMTRQRPETDAEYTLRIQRAIQRGIDAAEQGHVVAHEEAKRRFARWLTD
jgi:hypothetical protein